MSVNNSMLKTPEFILNFWFDPADETLQKNGFSSRWFSGGKAFDHEIKIRFQTTVELALNNKLNWSRTPKSMLATILLLDQFPRNIYRKQARAFAGDDQAQLLTKTGIDEKKDKRLSIVKRLFFYMPLMHSEHPEDQALCITQITQLLREAPKQLQPALERSLDFAYQHYNIIKTYGRFPYRNAILKRQSTPEEIEFLKLGIHFGQG